MVNNGKKTDRGRLGGRKDKMKGGGEREGKRT